MTTSAILLYKLNDASAFLHTADATAFRNAEFGAGTGVIALDNVACTGSETSLLSCYHDTHTGDCYHYQDAGVRCPVTIREYRSNGLGFRVKHIM